MRKPRIRLTDSQMLKVSVIKKSGIEATNLCGVLVDISRQGVQIKLNESLAIGERVRLTVTAEAIAFELHSYARARWVESDRVGWLIGCVLESRIEESSINDLAVDGVLERRHHERQPISSFAVQVKAELQPEFRPVQILDLSSGGFSGIAGHLDAKPGNRLLIKTREASQLVPAQVVWVNNFDSGQAVGCRFSSSNDHLLIRAMARGPGDSNRVRSDSARADVNKWSVIAVGASLIIVLYQLFWL